MKFYKVRRLNTSAFMSYLNQEVKLSYDQKKQLSEFLVNYNISENVEVKKHNPLYRISIPLYLLFCLCIIFIMPFKWLITGKWYFHYNGKVIKTKELWEEKMNI